MKRIRVAIRSANDGDGYTDTWFEEVDDDIDYECNMDRAGPYYRATEVDPLTQALQQILGQSGGECENDTSGIGACFRDGRKPGAKHQVDQCCPSCIAHRALNP